MGKIFERVVVVLFLVLGLIHLVIWPFAAMASLMGLAGHVPRGTPEISLYMAYLFHIGVICYPMIPIFSVAMTIPLFMGKKTSRPFILISALP
jgi:hypothetical protein